MKSRSIIILSVVLVIVFILFIIVAYQKPAKPLSDFERESFLGSGAQSTSLEFLRILQNLQKIDFAQSSIFQTQGFKNLLDFSVKIEPKEAGRNNPFAPTGGSEVFQRRFNPATATPSGNF